MAGLLGGSTLWKAFIVVVCAIASVVAVLVAVPFVLATTTLVLRRFCNSSKRNRRDDACTNRRSALYSGRVWHTRFLPVKHAFQYPLFIFCLDLEEVDDDAGLFTKELWPLSLIAAFRECDHLKNGEGLQENTLDKNGTDEKQAQQRQQSLTDRLFRLVAEKTNNSFCPSLRTHRILLVTHLTYYGYCFNPVSFYYIQDRATGEIHAMIGEVSNTPWNEMFCYVLHPDSTDKVKVTTTNETSSNQQQQLRYIFPKQFHVSPFMEMQYDYDWTFWSIKGDDDSIRITNNLRQQNDSATMQFSAKMVVQRRSMHPFRIAWHMSTFPMYCAIVQLWIHYEALRLFLKGVTFQPHPEGAETTASRLIGNIMAPFFAVQEWWDRRRTKRKEA